MKNRYFYLLILLFSLLSMKGYAQIRIEGEVFDENEIPLIGVSVVPSDSKNGTITDMDGKFSILVLNANSSLSFSYIGYMPQRIQLNGRKKIKVVMKEDSKLLDEVIVVGYGT